MFERNVSEASSQAECKCEWDEKGIKDDLGFSLRKREIERDLVTLTLILSPQGRGEEHFYFGI